MTFPSVTPYRTFDDFLVSAQGQEMRQALAQERPGLVAPDEGRNQVRAVASVDHALAQHPVQAFATIGDLMASPYGELLSQIHPDEVAHVRVHEPVRPTLGQVLGKTAPAAPASVTQAPRPRTPRVR